ncbi:MAG: GTP-binding protein [Burkholderiaceae bacterium]
MSDFDTTVLDPGLRRDHEASHDHAAALRFITCGSVDDGKSTLIGRLLMDSRSVLQDQLASVSKSGAVDLALFTDGLTAEREQGITIDVAYRYFSTAQRKFIIGDAPGHEQYTRNMVTAASSADAAVVLVDATKLHWHAAAAPAATHGLLPQTRRHSLLLQMLRVPSIVFAVNKLDAVADPALAFANIRYAIEAFAKAAGLANVGVVPISALQGHNVVTPAPLWCGYRGPALLDLLEGLPVIAAETAGAMAFPVQWVEKFPASAQTDRGRRVFWGRVANGGLRAGQSVRVFPGWLTARVAEVLDHRRRPGDVSAGNSAGIVLDREADVSRGDWLLERDQPSHAFAPSRSVQAIVTWLDHEPLVTGRIYWVLHGHRWVKARVESIAHRLNIHTLTREAADTLGVNEIGQVRLALQEELVTLPYAQSRSLGSLVLIDTAKHTTAGAALVL